MFPTRATISRSEPNFQGSWPIRRQYIPNVKEQPTPDGLTSPAVFNRPDPTWVTAFNQGFETEKRTV